MYTHDHVFMEEANNTILKTFIRIINLKKELEKVVTQDDSFFFFLTSQKLSIALFSLFGPQHEDIHANRTNKDET